MQTVRRSSTPITPPTTAPTGNPDGWKTKTFAQFILVTVGSVDIQNSTPVLYFRSHELNETTEITLTIKTVWRTIIFGFQYLNN